MRLKRQINLTKFEFVRRTKFTYC